MFTFNNTIVTFLSFKLTKIIFNKHVEALTERSSLATDCSYKPPWLKERV